MKVYTAAFVDPSIVNMFFEIDFTIEDQVLNSYIRSVNFLNFGRDGLKLRSLCHLLLSIVLLLCFCVCSGFGVISSQSVEDGFRNVDRRFFVPQVRQGFGLKTSFLELEEYWNHPT